LTEPMRWWNLSNALIPWVKTPTIFLSLPNLSQLADTRSLLADSILSEAIDAICSIALTISHG
jgi:hypothetical protein